MPEPTGKAVFLSYASQDAEAVLRIAEALRAAGVEVWFDRDELVGGDAWDAKIRGQIASCALFVPVISAATQARREGYFRIEWKLAAQRTHAMADGTPFLLPAVIDATKDGDALVPAEFRAVQWTRLAGVEGAVVEKFCARVRRLLEGAAEGVPALAAVPMTRSRTGPRRSLPWIGAVAAVLALVGAGWWLTAQRPEGARTPSVTSAESVGEVPRLVERARQLRSLIGLTRDRLGAAEELLKQASKLAPTDPDMLAVSAQVDALMCYRSWDPSEERRQAAGQRAARAVALAPGGFESRRAQAMVAGFLLRSSEALQEAEATYRRLSEERPRDADVLEELGDILLRRANPREAAEIFTRAGRRLRVAEAHMAAGQFRQAREAAVALLAERRSVEALVLKANVDLFGFNDREAAKASVSQLTPTELREDDAAGIALRLAVLSADAPGLLKLMELFPHPFVSILGINYPRRYWTGMAHEWLKKPDAARIEWRAALQTIEERLKVNPADPDALSWAALLHMCLGDVAATEQALRSYRNYRDLSTGYWDFHYCLPLLRVAGGEEEVIDRLAKTLREPPKGQFNTIVYAWARFSPEFDSLRGKPRFERLLREMRPADALPFAAQRQAVPAAAAEKSVAVLPFKNLSGDPAQDYMSDGLTVEIQTALSNERDLRVPGATSSFAFKDKAVPVPEIARALNVAQVVEGSVRKSGNQVRITVSLTRASDGFSEPLGTFTESPDDIFALQEKVARAVVAKLTKRNPTAGGVAGPAKNSAAYDLYLRARAVQTGAMSRATSREMLLLYEEAVRLDPDYAPAWARLAQAYSRVREAGADRTEQNAAKARHAATTALRLAPALPEAHLAMAAVKLDIDYDLDAAQRELDETERLRPNDAEVPATRALLELARGHWDDALARLIARAAESDPRNADRIYRLGTVLTYIGRFAAAEQLYERARAISPASRHIRRLAQNYLAWTGDTARASAIFDSAPGDSQVFQLDRARLRAAHGDLTAALAEFERVVTDNATGDPTALWLRGSAAYSAARLELRRNHATRAKELLAIALSAARERGDELPDDESGPALLARVHAARGEKAEAMAALDRAQRLAARTNSARSIAGNRVDRAEALMLLGDTDAAIAELRAVHEMGRGFGYRLRLEIEWEPLRGNPKFQQLMQEAEARAEAQPQPKK